MNKKIKCCNSANAQRARFHTELQQGPVSTIKARHELDILAPAARVHELRHGEGLNIVTHWETIETPEGNKHRVAVYVLLPGKWTEGA